MILYVITDTAARYRKDSGAGWFRISRLLEKLSGAPCLMLHYKQISIDLLAAIRPWAICHSGNTTDFSEYDVLENKKYRQVILDYNAAQIGFCGGHQIMAYFFGSTLGPMRRLKPNEPDISPYSPGYFKEWGIYPVRIVAKDPLFAGCGNIIRVQEYHRDEVKKLGAPLKLLASSAECRVQAFRHREKPLYGTQFHPEQSPKNFPAGLKILKNFFRIAKNHSR